jgi:hypothetical protein
MEFTPLKILLAFTWVVLLVLMVDIAVAAARRSRKGAMRQLNVGTATIGSITALLLMVVAMYGYRTKFRDGWDKVVGIALFAALVISGLHALHQIGQSPMKSLSRNHWAVTNGALAVVIVIVMSIITPWGSASITST